MTAVPGASTLGLPAVASSPSRDASCHINDDLIVSAEPTGCNPRTVLQFPSIFNLAFGGALDDVATHLIYGLQWRNVRRFRASACEERYRQRPKERHEQYARSRLPVVELKVGYQSSNSK